MGLELRTPRRDWKGFRYGRRAPRSNQGYNSSMGLVFLFAGAVLVYCGYALITNHRGANDWWIDYAQRQGQWGRIKYDSSSTAALGWWTGGFGVVFLIAG